MDQSEIDVEGYLPDVSRAPLSTLLSSETPHPHLAESLRRVERDILEGGDAVAGFQSAL